MKSLKSLLLSRRTGALAPVLVAGYLMASPLTGGTATAGDLPEEPEPGPLAWERPNFFYKSIWTDFDARIVWNNFFNAWVAIYVSNDWGKFLETDQDILWDFSPSGTYWDNIGAYPLDTAIYLRYATFDTITPADFDLDNIQDNQPYLASHPVENTLHAAFTRTAPGGDSDVTVLRFGSSLYNPYLGQDLVGWDNYVVTDPDLEDDQGRPDYAKVPLNRRWWDGDSAVDSNPVVAATSDGYWFAAWQTTQPTLPFRELFRNNQGEIIERNVGSGNLGIGSDLDIVWAFAPNDGDFLIQAIQPEPEEDETPTSRTITRQGGEEPPPEPLLDFAWSDARNVVPQDIPDDASDDVNPAVAAGRFIINILDEEGNVIEVEREGWLLVWSSASDRYGNSNRDRDILVARFVPSVPRETFLEMQQTIADAVAAGEDPEFQVDPIRFPEAFIFNDIANQGAVDPGSRLDTNSDDFPQVAFGNNVFVTVWVSTSSQGFVRRNLVYARSVDFGVSWSPPRSLSLPDEVVLNIRPRLATDGQGTWICAWQRATGLREIVYSISTDNALTWSLPRRLEPAREIGQTRSLSDLKSNGLGRWLAVFQDNSAIGLTQGALTSDLVTIRSDDNGQTWQQEVSPIKTDEDERFDGDPDIATDGSQTAVAVWSSTEIWNNGVRVPGGNSVSNIYYSISSNSGDNWTEPTFLPGNPTTRPQNEDFAPKVATDGDGRWIATWFSFNEDVDTGDRTGDIAIQAANGVGNWLSAPVFISEDAFDNPTDPDNDRGSDQFPSIDTDGNRWIAVWQSTAPSFASSPSTPANPGIIPVGADADIFFTITENTPPLIDPNGTSQDRHQFGEIWRVPWTGNKAQGAHQSVLTGSMISDAGDDFSPAIRYVGGGVWIVAWTSTDTLGGTIGTDTDILYSISRDNGTTWSAPSSRINLLAGTDFGNDTSVSLAAFGNRIVASWTTTEFAFGGGGSGGLLDESDLVYSWIDFPNEEWSFPLPINANSGDDFYDFEVDLEVNPNTQQWIATWTKQEPTDPDTGVQGSSAIYYSISPDGSDWSPEAVIQPVEFDLIFSEEDNDQDGFPDLIDTRPVPGSFQNNFGSAVDYDGENRWMALWANNAPFVGNNSTNPSDPFIADFEIIMTRSLTQSRIVSDPETIIIDVTVPLTGPVVISDESFILSQSGTPTSVSLTLLEDSTYFSITPSEAVLTADATSSAVVTVEFDADLIRELPTGTYSDTIVVVAPGTIDETSEVTVVINVTRVEPTPTPTATPMPTPRECDPQTILNSMLGLIPYNGGCGRDVVGGEDVLDVSDLMRSM